MDKSSIGSVVEFVKNNSSLARDVAAISTSLLSSAALEWRGLKAAPLQTLGRIIHNAAGAGLLGFIGVTVLLEYELIEHNMKFAAFIALMIIGVGVVKYLSDKVRRYGKKHQKQDVMEFGSQVASDSSKVIRKARKIKK